MKILYTIILFFAFLPCMAQQNISEENELYVYIREKTKMIESKREENKKKNDLRRLYSKFILLDNRIFSFQMTHGETSNESLEIDFYRHKLSNHEKSVSKGEIDGVNWKLVDHYINKIDSIIKKHP